MKIRINLVGLMLFAGSFMLMSYEKSGFEMDEKTTGQDSIVNEVYQHDPIMVDASFKNHTAANDYYTEEDLQSNLLVLSGSDEEKFKGFLAAILVSGI